MKKLLLFCLVFFAISITAQNVGHIQIFPKDSAVRVKWNHVPTWVDGDVTMNVPDSGSYYFQTGGHPLTIIGYDATKPQRNNGTLHFRKNRFGVDTQGNSDSDTKVEYGESVRICVDGYNSWATPDYFFEEIWIKTTKPTTIELTVWDNTGQWNKKSYKLKSGQNKLSVRLCGRCMGFSPQKQNDSFTITQFHVWLESCANPDLVEIYDLQGNKVFMGHEDDFRGKGMYVILYSDGSSKKVNFASNEPYFTPFSMD